MQFIPDMVFFQRILNLPGAVKKRASFIGPTSEHLNMFGDKVKARTQAVKAGLPVIPGSDGPVTSLKEAETLEGKMATLLLLKHH